jgi:hypothetical protein
MGEFDNPPLVRDVGDARKIEVALPRTLQVSVDDVRQVFPPSEMTGNQLLISTGAVRFGQDQPSDEDAFNEQNDYADVDDGQRRTVTLKLRSSQLSTQQFVGSGSFSALANIFLNTWGTNFLVAADDATTLFTNPTENGQLLGQDIWLEADVFAGIADDDNSQIKRMGYQSVAAIRR